MSGPDPYLLGYRLAEQERLERQSKELAPESAWLFDQIGVRAGWRVVEIGCGLRSTSRTPRRDSRRRPRTDQGWLRCETFSLACKNPPHVTRSSGGSSR